MPTLIEVLERLGIADRSQICTQLDISQPTFSRLFAAHRDRVVQLGRGRAVRYALRQRLRRVETPVPVWRVAPDGRVQPFGELEALNQGRFLLGDALYDDLPWMLWDLRPQGFIGRGFAHRDTELALPRDLAAWSSEDILVALTRRGEDCPGDLIVGREALERYLQSRVAPPPVSRDDYPRLIHAALHGDPAGSSAGGEQPKFAATLAADGGGVIVKFSPPIHTSAGAGRWADLLVCEHLASSVLREHGQPAALSELVEVDGRILLETRRFDRTPNGRRAMVSGLALDSQFAGVGADWARLAGALLRQKLLSAEDAGRLRLWQSFGRLIGNSDMHLGNVSFFTEDYACFALAPSYDMLPMRWAPTASGEVVERSPDFAGYSLDARGFGAAADMAEVFWCRVRACERLEGRWNETAAAALRELALVRKKMALLASG